MILRQPLVYVFKVGRSILGIPYPMNCFLSENVTRIYCIFLHKIKSSKWVIVELYRSGSASYGHEFLCVGKCKASTFQHTRIHINISHHCVRIFDWKCVIFKSFGIFHQHFIPSGKIKQNPKSTTLFLYIPKYFAALMKILKKIQSFPKSSAK